MVMIYCMFLLKSTHTYMPFSKNINIITHFDQCTQFHVSFGCCPSWSTNTWLPQDNQVILKCVLTTGSMVDESKTVCFHRVKLFSLQIFVTWCWFNHLNSFFFCSFYGVMIKIPYGVDNLHWPALFPIFSYWFG